MIYLKNLAGELIDINHDFSKETSYDLMNKLAKRLKLDNIWSIQILEYDNYKINKEYINYIILDDILIDILIFYKEKILLMDCYYEKYNIKLIYGKDIYYYDIYYNRYSNKFFKDIESIINDEDIYNNLYNLFINSKNLPIYYREKIAVLINEKWNTIN
jgi:hypothetical protein